MYSFEAVFQHVTNKEKSKFGGDALIIKKYNLMIALDFHTFYVESWQVLTFTSP